MITVRRPEVRPFTEKQIALLKTFADQAVIAIENLRLFRGWARTRHLSGRRRPAKYWCHRHSQTDTQPVFEVIAVSAQRLFGADDALICRVEGDRHRDWWRHYGARCRRDGSDARPARPWVR